MNPARPGFGRDCRTRKKPGRHRAVHRQGTRIEDTILKFPAETTDAIARYADAAMCPAAERQRAEEGGATTPLPATAIR